MIRTSFFLLILANLVFFAWTQAYFGTAADGREPQRLSNQLVPEKLRVVGVGIDSRDSARTEKNCRLVSGLALSEVQRLIAQAKERQPGLSWAIKMNDTPRNTYWVVIPPLANRPAADRKLVELKKREVADFLLILEEGPDQFAILLGVFETEIAASEYLQELAKRSVRSAKVQVREDPLDKAQLEARGPADALSKQLGELLNGQGAAKIGDCPAGA